MSEMTEEEREHMKAQVDELKKLQAEASETRHLTDGEQGDTAEGLGTPPPPKEDHGYDIPPPPDAEDTRTEVITAFLVYVTEDGKAIATSEIESTLADIKVRREGNIEDFRRACAEVVEDTRSLIQTQQMINTQMQMAQRMQEQAKSQQMLQGLDLNGLRGRG